MLLVHGAVDIKVKIHFPQQNEYFDEIVCESLAKLEAKQH